MAITYRENNGVRLSATDMDNNFRYLEDGISGLTASIATLQTNLASATASIDENMFTGVTGDFRLLLLVSGVTQSATFSFTNGILGTTSIAPSGNSL